MAASKGNCYNPLGRPKKELDWALFQNLCEIQCSQEEIAGVLNVCKETLTNHIKEKFNEDYLTVYKRLSAPGKMSLRRTQFKLAQKNAAMAIWLGKQYLDQRETPQEIHASDQLNKQFESVMNQITAMQENAKSPPSQPLS